MTFVFKCWASNPPTSPCDVEWGIDPVVGVAFAGALAVAALGLFALLYLLAHRSGR